MVKVLVAFTKTDWRSVIRGVLSKERSVAVSYAELGKTNLRLCGGSFDVIYLQAGVDRAALSQSLSTIKTRYPGSRLVLVLDNFGISDVIYGHRMGISAILDEDATRDQILGSLGAAIRGDLYLSSRVVDRSQGTKPLCAKSAAPASFSAPELSLLSEREMEVLRLVARGMANRAIAKSLFISEKTVKNHLYNIFRKIGVTDRTKAALFAIRALTGSGNETIGPLQVLAQSDI